MVLKSRPYVCFSFEAVAALKMLMAVFRVVTSYSLAGGYQRFLPFPFSGKNTTVDTHAC
jgi:hypothetical protein